ncbi:MAG: desulfoferrodoxin, partial [Candidatus Omnitrophica bacterium]|nr:desulfoferrodoxin [Candidatus Omnitrophota bacterium]
MTQLRELYRCEVCGNIVEIAHEGAPALVCCGKPMVKLEAKTEDKGEEKHVPVIEELDSGIKVKVGSVEHPMEEKHYIKFIEVLLNDRIMRQELKPGQVPEAKYCASKSDVIEVREFCTIHGLWKNK